MNVKGPITETAFLVYLFRVVLSDHYCTGHCNANNSLSGVLDVSVSPVCITQGHSTLLCPSGRETTNTGTGVMAG